MLRTTTPPSKHLTFGQTARNTLLTGINQVADAVSHTLGPKGRTIIIDQPYTPPRITKDGVSVAKSITLTDPSHNVGAKLARSVASKVNDTTGDGTTTATLLLRKMANEGSQAITTGLASSDLLNGILQAKKHVLSNITQQSRSTQKHDIVAVARVSANNDDKIGKMVGDIYAQIGRDGAVSVEAGRALDDSVTVVEGMVLDQGLLSRYFATDAKNSKAELRGADVAVCDCKLSTSQSVVPLLELCVKRKKPLVIVADTIDGDALTTLVLNKLRGLPVCAVRAPGFGETRKGVLEDVCVVTGARLMSGDEYGIKVDAVEAKHLGLVDFFVCSQEECVLRGGGGSVSEVQKRVEELKKRLKADVSMYEKEKLEGRIGRMTGGVGVVVVGGSCEAEVGERKDRIEDAVCAVKAAMCEGIVAGGGVALIRAGSGLDELKTKNWAERVGVEIVKKCTEEPARVIARNAGVDGGVVVERIRSGKGAFGFDARDGVFVDLMEKGIVDPTKVVRSAFEEGVSVGALVATSEGLVVEDAKKEL